MDEAINGVTLELLADIMSKDGELRAQHGEKRGREELRGFLAQRGLDENAWAFAHNAWWERFRADPTGKLEAKFHQMLSERSLKAHFGDVRDMSGDVVEGVTLDKYAELCVAMSKPGIDAEATARQHGLPSAAEWQKVNAAWTAKMGADTSMKLTTQFGMLYQKHAGPAFAEQMLEQTAAILAESNKPRDKVDEPEADLSQPTLLAKLKSSSQNERWEAARWLATRYNKDDPGTQANLACIPVLLEIIERHDEHTASKAEDAIVKLTSDLEHYTDDVRSTITRCGNRAREKLATMEAAFAPIKDKAVPERIVMQARIQEYQSLLDRIGSALNEWPAGGSSASSSAPSVAHATEPRASGGSGGMGKGLMALPVVLAGLGFGAWKMMSAPSAPVASPAAAATATAAAETAAPAPPPDHPTTTASPGGAAVKTTAAHAVAGPSAAPKAAASAKATAPAAPHKATTKHP